jgi:hypothetical protein
MLADTLRRRRAARGSWTAPILAIERTVPLIAGGLPKEAVFVREQMVREYRSDVVEASV